MLLSTCLYSENFNLGPKRSSLPVSLFYRWENRDPRRWNDASDVQSWAYNHNSSSCYVFNTVSIYLFQVSSVTFELAASIYIYASKDHSRDLTLPVHCHNYWCNQIETFGNTFHVENVNFEVCWAKHRNTYFHCSWRIKLESFKLHVTGNLCLGEVMLGFPSFKKLGEIQASGSFR